MWHSGIPSGGGSLGYAWNVGWSSAWLERFAGWKPALQLRDLQAFDPAIVDEICRLEAGATTARFDAAVVDEFMKTGEIVTGGWRECYRNQSTLEC